VVEHLPHHPKVEGLGPAATVGTKGLYHITLRTCNVRDAERLGAVVERRQEKGRQTKGRWTKGR
jgi:hypothetical protein